MGSENKLDESPGSRVGEAGLHGIVDGSIPPIGAPGRIRPAGRRFQQRRETIVAAAIPLLNNYGFKGMRLVEVGDQIGLKSTGITYYFPRKEDLALACIEHGIEVFQAFLSAAEKEATPAERVRRLVHEYTRHDALVRQHEATPLASFAAIRALEGAHRARASSKYKDMFKRTRRLLEQGASPKILPRRAAIHTLILLEQLYWASDWLSHYEIEEAPRIADRMAGLMLHGLRSGAQAIETHQSLDISSARAVNEDFMRAATREINKFGYHGASVDRISASINLTKGAFYHHHDAKDELVGACFRRSFDLIRSAQRSARERDASEWEKLAMTVSALVQFQLSDNGPLLRTSALSSLPQDLQGEIRELSYKVGRTFSSMISDAIAEGSVRPVDSTIAAYMLAAGINAAADVSSWPEAEGADVANVYARALICGILED